MHERIKNFVAGAILFTVIGGIIYATVNDITPTDTKKALSKAKATWDNAVEEVKKAKETNDNIDITTKVKETSKEVNMDSILAQEEKEKEKKEEKEVLYIDGELYERVIGEKCDKIHHACNEIILLMKDSSCRKDGDLTRKERKALLKYTETIVENYEYVMEQTVPKQHQNIINAFHANCGKGYRLSKDFLDNYKDFTVQDFKDLDDGIVLMRSGTDGIFSAYRLAK